MYEIVYYFLQNRGILKGLELDGSYKLPERDRALADAKRIAKRKGTTGVSVIDLEQGEPIAYWNREAGWDALRA